jgi:hypothetical protein
MKTYLVTVAHATATADGLADSVANAIAEWTGRTTP